MQWVQVGEPEVQRQRGKWVVRQAGYDAATGSRRVRQLGTFPSRRAALTSRSKAFGEVLRVPGVAVGTGEYGVVVGVVGTEV